MPRASHVFSVLLAAAFGCAGEPDAQDARTGEAPDADVVDGAGLNATGWRSFDSAVNEDFRCLASFFARLRKSDDSCNTAGYHLGTPIRSPSRRSGVVLDGGSRYLFDTTLAACGNRRFEFRYTFDYVPAATPGGKPTCGYEVFVKDLANCRVVGYGVAANGEYLPIVPTSLAYDKFQNADTTQLEPGATAAEEQIIRSRGGCMLCHPSISSQSDTAGAYWRSCAKPVPLPIPVPVRVTPTPTPTFMPRPSPTPTSRPTPTPTPAASGKPLPVRTSTPSPLRAP